MEGQPPAILGTGAGVTSHGSAATEQCGCRRERAQQPSAEGVLALAVHSPPFVPPPPRLLACAPHEVCVPQGDTRWLEQSPWGTLLHGHDRTEVFLLHTLSSAQHNHHHSQNVEISHPARCNLCQHITKSFQRNSFELPGYLSGDPYAVLCFWKASLLYISLRDVVRALSSHSVTGVRYQMYRGNSGGGGSGLMLPTSDDPNRHINAQFPIHKKVLYRPPPTVPSGFMGMTRLMPKETHLQVGPFFTADVSCAGSAHAPICRRPCRRGGDLRCT